MKVVIAGGTGFLGSGLAASLRADRHDVVTHSRTRRSRRAGWRGRMGSDASAGDWAAALDGADAVD